MLQNIRVVLIETSHAGNIGSVIRVMKTMGLTNLWLVNPLVKPDSQTIALAAGANDLISKTQIVDTLDQAIVRCCLVIGTSARSRTLPWPTLDPRECGFKSIREASRAPVALVFGRERVGLTNEEILKCHYHVTISTSPEFSSLNLAMATLVIAYEVHMAWLAIQKTNTNDDAVRKKNNYPPVEDIERFYEHLKKMLIAIGFIRLNKHEKVMSRLRRLFTRARLERRELNILRGILASIEQKTQDSVFPLSTLEKLSQLYQATNIK